ncbi:hypothetical protein [Nocardia tengchongensis]|uniref:hypothetical protein n=1 Tax=Nocardia tengchongensis TaxID=2055889 RepID=UPI0036CD1FB3
MTTFDVRPAGPAADLSAARFAALTSEVTQLRAELTAKNREMTTMGRLVDDVLDRESMHVYDPDMERLTTAAEMERRGLPRVQHGQVPTAGPRWSFPTPPTRTLPAPDRPRTTELERTGAWTPGIEWDGFDR